MSSASPPTRARALDDDNNGAGASFATLRQLLVGPEQVALEDLKRRLDDRQVRSEELSSVVAEAIALRSRRDRSLQQTLNPIVEEAVRISVARNPRILADTLFPIIGEAVRKAVAHALRGMMESMNQVLERSLSWQGLVWRVEALRTGKSFGEIVLTRSLRYRVEQVFLIHRESSLLLGHAARDEQSVQDADLVSGMLSVVQDFMQDSFHESSSEGLETVEHGGYTVWLQHGPLANLAAVVTGTPPNELRTLLQKTLERIHQDLGPALASYDGDTSQVAGAQPLLDACLLGQQSTTPVRHSRLWMFPVAALLIVMGLFGWLSIRERMRWDALVNSLRGEAGIVLTGAERTGGRYRLTGLRDPLSLDPEQLVAASGLDPAKVTSRWEPYVSLDPKFSAARILQQQKDEVEHQVVRFALNASRLEAEQAAKLDGVAVSLMRLQQHTAMSKRSVVVDVQGHTDPTGREERNAQLSEQRATAVLQALVDRGVPRGILRAVGVGSNQPMQSSGEYLAELNRRVTFHVVINRIEP
jgi:outer membrane protein OmpA-like peptidoglycan-associated protein